MSITYNNFCMSTFYVTTCDGVQQGFAISYNRDYWIQGGPCQGARIWKKNRFELNVCLYAQSEKSLQTTALLDVAEFQKIILDRWKLISDNHYIVKKITTSLPFRLLETIPLTRLHVKIFLELYLTKELLFVAFEMCCVYSSLECPRNSLVGMI